MGPALRPRTLARELRRRWQTEVDVRTTRRGRADLALFHEFSPSPSGGGHQFLRALVTELERRGLAVELNRLSGETPACLFNSFNFDFRRLRRFAGREARFVHRIDGPIGVYRGFDDGSDVRIAEINAELASATICQSRFSLEKHRELGLELVEPVVIPNTVDPAIFHPPARRAPLEGRTVGVIATSWSDNPRKGAGALRALADRLDPALFALTFAGRPPDGLDGWRLVAPLPSLELAELLRAHDVYVAPSRDDPCSNALLEALACGLPAAYRRSGGHPELVGDAGLPFDEDDELADVVVQLAAEIDERRARISTHPIARVADRYLDVLHLSGAA